MAQTKDKTDPPMGKIFLLKDVEYEVVLDAVMYGIAQIVGMRLVYLTEEEYHDKHKHKKERLQDLCLKEQEE